MLFLETLFSSGLYHGSPSNPSSSLSILAQVSLLVLHHLLDLPILEHMVLFLFHSPGNLIQPCGFKSYLDTKNSKNCICRLECISKLHKFTHTTAYLIFFLTSLKFNTSTLDTTSNTHTCLLFPEISPFQFVKPEILQITLTSLHLLYLKSKSSILLSKTIQKVILNSSVTITLI